MNWWTSKIESLGSNLKSRANRRPFITCSFSSALFSQATLCYIRDTLNLSFKKKQKQKTPQRATREFFFFISCLKHFFQITFDLLFNTRSDKWLAATGRHILGNKDTYLHGFTRSVRTGSVCIIAPGNTLAQQLHTEEAHDSGFHLNTAELWTQLNPCHCRWAQKSSAGSGTIHTAHLWFWQIIFYFLK